MDMKQPKGMRRKQQKAETNAIIVNSARYLFETLSYEKVTIRAVAAHAQIGLGTIYKHFPNKLSMLAAAFFGDLKMLYQDAISTVPEDEPFKTQFVHISKEFFSFYTAHELLSRAYLSHLFFFDREWMDQINAFDDAYADKISELIRAAQDRGEISALKDSNALALALMSNYFFVLVNCFLRDNDTDPAQLAHRLESLVEQTLL